MESSSTEPTSFQDAVRPTLGCLWCSKKYRPKRPNQEYCRPACRQKSLRYRKKHGGDMQEPRPRLGARLILHAQQTQRLQARVPMLQTDPFLTARARLAEAIEQRRRWEREIEERKAALASLEPPAMRAEYFPLTAGTEPPLNLEATHCAVVSTDGQIGVIAFGYANPQAQDPDPEPQQDASSNEADS